MTLVTLVFVWCYAIFRLDLFAYSGILELHIEDELRVEGALHSNGERGLDSLAGGGAGGSVLNFFFLLFRYPGVTHRR